MNRAKRIIELYTRFVDNYHLFSEHNDALLVDCEYEKWLGILSERSKVQRKIFYENEQLLAEARELMSEPVESKEEADEILVFYRKLVSSGVYDYALLDVVYKPLSDFYTDSDDNFRLIGLNVTACAVIMYAFEGREKTVFPINPKECALKAIECSKKVNPLDNLEAWMSTFSAYANLLGSLTSVYEELYPEFMKNYKEAMAYFNDSELGNAILATSNGTMLYGLVKKRIIYNFEAYDFLSEEERHVFAEEFNKLLNEHEEEITPVDHVLMEYATRFKMGEVDGKIAFEKLKDMLEKLNPCFTREDESYEAEIFMECQFLIENMFSILKSGVFSKEETLDRLEYIRLRSREILASIPYAYMTEYVNYNCGEFCIQIAPYLQEEQELIEAIRSLLILRQPITYIHSLMVKSISVAIAKVMLEKKPELFVPLFGKNIHEVVNRRNEILEYISMASSIHDLGKNYMGSVINNQYRKITDVEFNLIKKHTETGPELYKDNRILEKYYDVMLGHHKTYDGKSGYPEYFDNVASPYRIIIDLISIADCTDAATDIWGRNYTSGKDFSSLFEELVRDKGQRYNPDIVNLIADNPELFEELSHITGEGRKKIYYFAYRHIMKIGANNNNI